MMKRSRSDEQVMMHESLATVANYLMLLSNSSPVNKTAPTTTLTPSHTRVFECKTCNRQFSSFQALGGHRASHKKPRLSDGPHSSDTSSNSNSNSHSSPAKPKTHECSICGLEFAIGQALGGHMRRHRAVYTENGPGLAPSTTLSLSLTGPKKPVAEPKRVVSGPGPVLCLDLNLTPGENSMAAAIFG